MTNNQTEITTEEFCPKSLLQKQNEIDFIEIHFQILHHLKIVYSLLTLLCLWAFFFCDITQATSLKNFKNYTIKNFFRYPSMFKNIIQILFKFFILAFVQNFIRSALKFQN